MSVDGERSLSLGNMFVFFTRNSERSESCLANGRLNKRLNYCCVLDLLADFRVTFVSGFLVARAILTNSNQCIILRTKFPRGAHRLF